MTDDPHHRVSFGRKNDEAGPNPYAWPDEPSSTTKPGLIQRPMPSWYLVIGLIAGFTLACAVGWLLG